MVTPSGRADILKLQSQIPQDFTARLSKSAIFQGITVQTMGLIYEEKLKISIKINCLSIFLG